MELNYLDIIPEDIAYLIFTYIDDHNILSELFKYEPFVEVLTNPFSYRKKLKENYPMINSYIYIDKFITYDLGLKRKENLLLLFQLYSSEYFGLTKRINNATKSIMDGVYAWRSVPSDQLIDRLRVVGLTKFAARLENLLGVLEIIIIELFQGRYNYDLFVDANNILSMEPIDTNTAINLYLEYFEKR